VIAQCKRHRARVESLERRTLLAADFSYVLPIGSQASGGAPNNDLANAVVVDRRGNTYVVGGFAETVDFDPGAKAARLTSAGFTDVFVAKYAANGAFLWARQAGGDGEDLATSVAVDADDNVYVGGAFATRADFRPGKRTLFVQSNGEIDGFVWKLDAAGNFVRVVPMGGGSADAVAGLAVDAGGNVLATGLFQGPADFGKKDMASASGHDAFVVKLDATFSFVYAKRLGGLAEDQGAGIATDAQGNAYVTGTFNLSGDFNPGKRTATLTSTGSEDAFLVRLDAAGNFVYAKQFGGGQNDEGIALAVDRNGNVLVAGAFAGTVDFNPGAGVSNLTSAGNSDVFVAKLSAAGGFVWARRAGGALPDGVHTIRVNRAGDAFVGGQFNGTADFDPGAGTFNLAGTPNVANGFVWRLSAAAGSLVYARMIKAQAGGFADVAALALDAGGNVLLAGKFSGTVDFDPGSRTRNRSTSGGTSFDAFLEKLLA
jgi:hypothetical protein